MSSAIVAIFSDEEMRAAESVVLFFRWLFLASAWNRVLDLCAHGRHPTESALGLARMGHPNAKAIVADYLASSEECVTCGPLEDCPSATPEHYAKRDALRTLARLMGVERAG